jgi:hypothetical protein
MLRPSVVTDGEKPYNSEGVATHSNDSTPADGFPSEPFPCPACGQMLGPSCRVCVACKRPINPAEIKRLELPVGGTFEPRTPAVQRSSWQFSWRIFFIVFLLWVLLAGVAERFLGPVRSQWFLGSVVILTSAWVYYDAHNKLVPKPLRWGLGSLLLWIVLFPWYLARRKDPAAPCGLEEVSSFKLLLAPLVVFFLMSFVIIVLKQLGVVVLPGGH